jgi:hypothetical protein
MEELLTVFYFDIRGWNSNYKVDSWGFIIHSDTKFPLCFHLEKGSGVPSSVISSRHFARGVKLSLTFLPCLD